MTSKATTDDTGKVFDGWYYTHNKYDHRDEDYRPCDYRCLQPAYRAGYAAGLEAERQWLRDTVKWMDDKEECDYNAALRDVVISIDERSAALAKKGGGA